MPRRLPLAAALLVSGLVLSGCGPAPAPTDGTITGSQWTTIASFGLIAVLVLIGAARSVLMSKHDARVRVAEAEARTAEAEASRRNP